ncbi:MAG: M20/M25/M40 family metallo-hydrolase [bacterium]
MDTQSLTAARAVPLLQGLIRNACVNTGRSDSGGETRSIEFLRDFLSGYDIATEILYDRPDRANLIARIPGGDQMTSSVAYMGHVDVVPAEAGKWRRDPFGGELVDGEVWGRGAVDMLGMVATSAAAMSVIAEGPPPPGDVLFIAVSDEEAGGTYGARYLLEHHAEAVKCDYMITEVGGMHLSGSGSPATSGGITMSVGEKGVCWVRVRFSGVPGHGSMPYRADNAAVKAATAAARLARFRTRADLSGIVREMSSAFLRSRFDRLLARTPRGFEAAVARLYESDRGAARFLHTAAHTSISPNEIHSGTKVNIIPDSAELTLDIRILPGQGVEDVQMLLREGMGDLGEEAEIEFFEFYPSNVSPRDTPLMRASERILEDVLPGIPIVPVFLGGVTDGRYWRQKGTTVYGFAAHDPRLTLDRFSQLIHGIDERISVSSLEKNLRYLSRLPFELNRT